MKSGNRRESLFSLSSFSSSVLFDFPWVFLRFCFPGFRLSFTPSLVVVSFQSSSLNLFSFSLSFQAISVHVDLPFLQLSF